MGPGQHQILSKGLFTPSESKRESEKDQGTSGGDQRQFFSFASAFVLCERTIISHLLACCARGWTFRTVQRPERPEPVQHVQCAARWGSFTLIVSDWFRALESTLPSYLTNWGCNPFLEQLASFIKKSKHYIQFVISSDIGALTLSVNGPLDQPINNTYRAKQSQKLGSE